MFKLAKKGIFIALAVTSSQVMAENHGFSGNGELGFSNSTGNTESNALYAAVKLNYEQPRYDWLSKLEISNKSEDGNQTEERYALEGQYNRYYADDKNFYSFMGAKLERSVFENIELESQFSVGLGKRLYKSDSVLFQGQVGVGYQNTDYITDGLASDDQVLYQGKLDYSNQINQQVKFTQDFIIGTGSEQTKIEANTGVSVKVAEKMNLKASYKYRNNSNPAPGTKKTDTLTLVSLTYDF